MKKNQRIIIVGGGLAGALQACLLGQAGFEVVVYERLPDPRLTGALGGRSINLAISDRAIYGLKLAGLDQIVLNDAIAMRGRAIHSPTGQLSYQPYSKNPNDAINSVSRGGLNITMFDAADKLPNVTHHFDQRCVDVDLDKPAVKLLNTKTNKTKWVEGDIVIGADGAYSAVRDNMRFVERFDFDQLYLAHGFKELCIPPTKDGEFAMEPNALHIWPRGGYMMIALPNKDRTFTCTLFWPFEGDNSFETIKKEADIQPFFQEHFPDAAALMPTLVEDYQANPTSSLMTIRCGPWYYKDKVVLIGDSAHAVVPFYGQGINAGFEDCAALMECIKVHSGNWEEVFSSYYKRRKENADAIRDLALSNFLEMRDRAASPVFRMKKKGERILHKLFPQWYLPLYNMISFSRIPYAEAVKKAKAQDRVIILVAIVVVMIFIVLLAILWGLMK